MAFLARVNSSLWGTENNGQEIKLGDGIVASRLLWALKRRQFLRQSNQSSAKGIHLLANWAAAVSKCPACWLCKLFSLTCKAPLHVAQLMPPTACQSNGDRICLWGPWNCNSALMASGPEFAANGPPLSTDDAMDLCLFHHGDSSWHGNSCYFHT